MNNCRIAGFCSENVWTLNERAAAAGEIVYCNGGGGGGATCDHLRRILLGIVNVGL